MRMIIQSPAGIEAEAGNISAIQTSLVDGKPLTILPRHAPLMGEIGRTTITARIDGQSKTYGVKRGVLLVQNNLVTVLTSGMQEEENA